MMLPNYGSSRTVDEVSLWPIRLTTALRRIAHCLERLQMAARSLSGRRSRRVSRLDPLQSQTNGWLRATQHGLPLPVAFARRLIPREIPIP
jgi:hypothetical protein